MIIFLLLSSSFAVSSNSICYNKAVSISNFVGNTLYVGGSGPNNYTTIQAAIDDSYDGDTVFVYNGTYYENNIMINKTLFLKGEDKNTTIIDGDKGGDIMYLTNDGICICGFTIQDDGDIQDAEGIFICYASNCIIKDNKICMIRELGIWCLRGNNNTIKDNFLIVSNGHGIVLTFSHDNEIQNNYISNNGIGVLIDESYNNLVTENIISDNYLGLCLCSFDTNIGRNTITRNSIINSKRLGILIDLSSENIVEKNNFIDNRRHAKFSSSFDTQWTHNYWQRQRILPKPIFGIYHNTFPIPYLNFDWHPAKEPYKIPNVS